MNETMRHPMSAALRNMSGLVNSRALDEAADELDRLNQLIITSTTQASASYSESKRQVALLKARIEELEHATNRSAPPAPAK